MEFSRQEYWSGLSCPPPGHFPNPGIKPMCHVSCIGRRVLYHWHHLGSPLILSTSSKSVFNVDFCEAKLLVLVCLTRFLQYPHFQMAIWLHINSRLKVLFDTLMVLIHCLLRVLLPSFFPLNVICFSIENFRIFQYS